MSNGSDGVSWNVGRAGVDALTLAARVTTQPARAAESPADVPSGSTAAGGKVGGDDGTSLSQVADLIEAQAQLHDLVASLTDQVEQLREDVARLRTMTTAGV